jgi:hypothetical protein
MGESKVEREPIVLDGPRKRGRPKGSKKIIPPPVYVITSYHPMMLKGIQEMADFYRVVPRLIIRWINHHGLPVVKLPDLPHAQDEYRLPVRDALAWLCCYRPRDYLIKTGQIKPPPELGEVVGAIIQATNARYGSKAKKRGGPGYGSG